MYRTLYPGLCRSKWFAAALLLCTTTTYGIDPGSAKELMAAGKLQEAIDLLTKEVEENPAHEAARILLAEAYEDADMPDDAIDTWQDLIALSRNEANLGKARRAIIRLRRQELDRTDLANLSSTRPREDPFKIPMPEIEWEGLEVVEDSNYLPPILPPPYDSEVPPFAHETEHFTVYSANERLSKVIGERTEIYLDFMTEKLFAGRSWAMRFPIIVYTTYQDYVQHGAPAGSGGVTMPEITGGIRFILLFQLRSESLLRGGSSRGGSGGASGRQVWRYGIESVLPHELTHAVISEFFAGQPTPRWLHEAVAGRFEQTRDHYGEAARLARKAVAGEYFRMRDLFDQKSYPERIALFYEQSATVALYLFEAGPEAMHVFLSELAAGNDHDAACAAALGIPKENAVEEFERRWVEWMRVRYIKDLDAAQDGTDVAEAVNSNHAIFQPSVNEVDTFDNLENWRQIDLGSLDAFMGVGTSKKDWSAGGGKLRCSVSGEEGSALLGVRMNETAPVAVSCDVKFLGNPGDENHWFGFAQLDADLNDTNVEVIASLPDSAQHKVVCLWSDELAIYVDGICRGRYPAFHVTGDAPDIDYPLALVAYGPVEIQGLKIASIEKFSEKPLLAQDDGQPQRPDDRRRDRRGRRGRRGQPEP